MSDQTSYFATVARGLETIAAQELTQLGAEAVEPGFCGVAFRGDRSLLYRVNLWARLPFRILVTLGEFPCQDADDLDRGIQGLDWAQYLPPDRTLAVTATGKTAQLNHTHFTALRVKNAIVDWQRSHAGERSSVDVQDPDVRINVHLGRDRCVVSLDSSGSSLHRRGYRPAVGAAPLKESLAAALIALSGWQADCAFYDPLCGSGTLPLEATLLAMDVAPGLFRERFGFETWPDFDAALLDRLLADADAARKATVGVPIWGSDRDPQMIEQAQINAGRCDVLEQVWFSQVDLAEVVAPAETGVMICNPPYGERLGHGAALGEFYRLLGDVLKQQFKGWTVFILSGNKELAQAIRLKSSQRIPVYNGNLPCQLMKYELY